MKTIGLTGGIGSGKSYISRIMRDVFDVPVFNCDIEARRLMLLDPDIRAGLTALVGSGLYSEDGMLDKQLLADFMFVQGRVAEVNALVHPAVRRWFGEWRRMYDVHSRVLDGDLYPYVAIESAILVECGFTDLCDEVWLVTAPPELRISRAMARDGATREQIQARIDAQITDDERRRYATHIICNDGTTDIQSILSTFIPSWPTRLSRT